MSQSGAVIPGDRPEVPDRQQGHQITNAIPNSPLGTDSGEEQETGIATANTPRLGQVRRGFWISEKSPAPKPQSAPVEAFGELFASHPNNREHSSTFEQSDEQEHREEHRESESAIEEKVVYLDSAELPQAQPICTEATSLTRRSSKSSAASIHENRAMLPDQKPFPGIVTATQVPQIQVTTPSNSQLSLVTGVLNSRASSRQRTMDRSIPTPPDSADRRAEPDTATNLASSSVTGFSSMATEPTAAIQSLQPSDAPVAVPQTDQLQNVQPALVFDVPRDPIIGVSRGRDTNPPHARNRLRGKLKQRVNPALKKARKLILKKRILSVILGKKLTAVVEPHLNGATSVPAQNVPCVPCPTPL